MKKHTEEEVPGMGEIKNGAAGRPVAPNIHTLSQGACKYITWCCKGVKGALQVKLRLKTLRWSDYPGLGGPILPPEGLKMEKEGRRRGQRDVMMEEVEEI